MALNLDGLWPRFLADLFGPTFHLCHDCLLSQAFGLCRNGPCARIGDKNGGDHRFLLASCHMACYPLVMPKRSSKKPGPKDVNELAQSIVNTATGYEEPEEATIEDADSGKNPAAVALGRLGGKKGGPARARKLTAKERSAIARKAAQERWRHSGKGGSSA